MGKRREPRIDIKVPVRIFGTDQAGQIFSETVFTVNVSRHGAEVSGIRAQLQAEEIVGITYGQTKVQFRVKWVGAPGTPKAGRLGLLNMSPEKTFWDFPLPVPSSDSAWRDAHDRRLSPRIKCVSSVEIYPNQQAAPIRARTADLSMGGCFVEMPNPLPQGMAVRIALWLKESKLWASGKVVHSTPGFGIGLQFIEVSESDRGLLRQFLQSLTRLPI